MNVERILELAGKEEARKIMEKAELAYARSLVDLEVAKDVLTEQLLHSKRMRFEYLMANKAYLEIAVNETAD